ncbi:hypothetical protein BGZ63DRAFT_205430 [Mariannaea sp. PMI_226]|nr:hypothetical protein BGZ63DRAFT_205430 [Mariannaea sp. PMI_226]
MTQAWLRMVLPTLNPFTRTTTHVINYHVILLIRPGTGKVCRIRSSLSLMWCGLPAPLFLVVNLFRSVRNSRAKSQNIIFLLSKDFQEATMVFYETRWGGGVRSRRHTAMPGHDNCCFTMMHYSCYKIRHQTMRIHHQRSAYAPHMPYKLQIPATITKSSDLVLFRQPVVLMKALMSDKQVTASAPNRPKTWHDYHSS